MSLLLQAGKARPLSSDGSLFANGCAMAEPRMARPLKRVDDFILMQILLIAVTKENPQ